MKIRKLATSTIWASVWFMFVAVCFCYFLLLPAKTVTLVGSSAHWKAEDVVHVQMLDRGWHETSRNEIKIWWTGTADEATQVQYKLTGLHGVVMTATEDGPFYPWVINLSNGISSDEEIKYGLFLTITWQGKTETLHLQKR